MSYTIEPFEPKHAHAAAELHVEGQPGTFLTSLGPAFLRALYAEMAANPRSFGFVAVDAGQVIGVVTGATDSSGIFKDLIMRRGFKLILPVAVAVLKKPSLVGKIWQTISYPNQTKAAEGEAEMLYLAARAERRGEGIGKALWWAFAEEARRRGFKRLGLSVDEGSAHAVRFHELQGMHLDHTFTMYGRRMRWYVLPLTTQEEGHAGQAAQ